jgi:hypothetical protein
MLSLMFKAMMAGWQLFVVEDRTGNGEAGVCFCGRPLHPVAGDPRGWCDRHGFETRQTERGWPAWCPRCKFHLPPPEGGYLSCPTCLWYTEWPPQVRPPRRRKLKAIGC